MPESLQGCFDTGPPDALVRAAAVTGKENPTAGIQKGTVAGRMAGKVDYGYPAILVQNEFLSVKKREELGKMIELREVDIFKIIEVAGAFIL